jgi:TatD DNase family protein
MEFLSRLAADGEIDYVGEAGFDFSGDTPLRIRNEANLLSQKEAFEFQLSLAARQGLPLVVHVRKGMDIILGYGQRLARLPSVIFHSWPGRIQDANAILKQGTNAYFSFGTTLLRDARHALETCALLAPDRILSETDAPWQPPKGTPWTNAAKIIDVVEKIAILRHISPEAAQSILAENFFAAFGARI